jgi:hypothetical protein
MDNKKPALDVMRFKPMSETGCSLWGLYASDRPGVPHRHPLRVTQTFPDPLNSFCQSNRHGNNTSKVFYFRSVLPSAAGSG